MSAAEDAMEGRFNAFCVVGLGNHARTKLIPALAANGQRIAGLVTRGGADGLQSMPTFEDVDIALASLPPQTVFVIATPPAVHFVQAMPLIRAGRDVVVEKPAFTSLRDAVDATAEMAKSGSVLVEAFMYRHTNLYRHLLDAWRTSGPIRSIEADFLVPEMPTAGTFRQGADIASSSLYDMGCYPLSLLSDLGLPLNGLAVAEVGHPGHPGKESVRLHGRLAGVEVEIRIGVGPSYVNRVLIRDGDGRSTTFEPFFFGRPGERRIVSGPASSPTERTVLDDNAFEEMFATPRSAWLADQPERLRRMIDVTVALERLGADLEAIRRNAVPDVTDG